MQLLAAILILTIFTAVCTSSEKKAAPKFRNETSQTHFQVPIGQKLKLRCNVHGVPPPRIEFFHKDSKLQTSRSVLNIEIANYSDAGTYYCKAFNEMGEIWRNFTVEIIDYEPAEMSADDRKIPSRALVRKSGEKYAPFFTKSDMPKMVVRPVASSVNFDCAAEGEPRPTISWLKDGKEIQREFGKKVKYYKKYELIINDLLVSDAGNYECIVSNELDSLNRTFTLEMHERFPHKPIFKDGTMSNQTVFYGETARFVCEFISDLHPSVQFVKHYQVNNSYHDENGSPFVEVVNNSETSETDPYVLYLHNTTFEDEGFYTCLAANALGISYRSAYLQVYNQSESKVPEEAPKKYDLYHYILFSVVCFIILLFLVIIVFLVRRFTKKKKELSQQVMVQKRVILEAAEKLEDTDKFVVPSVRIDYHTVLVKDTKTKVNTEYDLPIDLKYEFPREKLQLKHILGEGAFGAVYLAEANLTLEEKSFVAVKMLKPIHTDAEMTSLVKEMELMKLMGDHQNIIKLHGCCTQDGPLYVIEEYCEKGNLRDLLRSSRLSSDHFIGYLEPISFTQCLTLKTLLSYAYQVTKAMEYLSSQNFLHMDLAARNVLVTKDNVIKLADFGLAKFLASRDYYQKKSNCRLPIKWMALEALSDRVFTEKSDVWSFGVLLWEIFSLGCTPYPSIAAECLFQKLKGGYRLPKPNECPCEIYRVMLECMNHSPKDRPTFKDLGRTLDRIMLDSMERVYLELGFEIVTTPENSSSEEEDFDDDY